MNQHRPRNTVPYLIYRTPNGRWSYEVLHFRDGRNSELHQAALDSIWDGNQLDGEGYKKRDKAVQKAERSAEHVAQVIAHKREAAQLREEGEVREVRIS